MLSWGKTRTVHAPATVSPARSQETYQRYAVTLYRQALLNPGDPHPGQRRTRIHPREMAALLRVVLRRLTTPPSAAAEDRDQV
jgi:hypothetical protein